MLLPLWRGKQVLCSGLCIISNQLFGSDIDMHNIMGTIGTWKKQEKKWNFKFQNTEYDKAVNKASTKGRMTGS